MITIRQKSVNVDRKQLLGMLRENLEAHAKEYAEALFNYKGYIAAQLREAHSKVQSATPEQATKITVSFNPPQDHRKDYMDAIEMLEYSTDEVINLDQESFKAYIKNEWSWMPIFKGMAESYKMLG